MKEGKIVAGQRGAAGAGKGNSPLPPKLAGPRTPRPAQLHASLGPEGDKGLCQAYALTARPGGEAEGLGWEEIRERCRGWGKTETTGRKHGPRR